LASIRLIEHSFGLVQSYYGLTTELLLVGGVAVDSNGDVYVNGADIHTVPRLYRFTADGVMRK
jgi:hypothetical protein